MIRLHPYDDLSAMAVIRQLDHHDQVEADLTRGAATPALALFAQWRSMQAIRIASHVATRADGTPFAVFALSNTGQAGVAQAALLARDHARFRRPLATLAAAIRAGMPGFAIDRGIHRIEARAWADHPTASALLTALGFDFETDMPGFGLSGTVTFRQFAWLSPILKGA